MPPLATPLGECREIFFAYFGTGPLDNLISTSIRSRYAFQSGSNGNLFGSFFKIHLFSKIFLQILCQDQKIYYKIFLLKRSQHMKVLRHIYYYLLIASHHASCLWLKPITVNNFLDFGKNCSTNNYFKTNQSGQRSNWCDGTLILWKVWKSGSSEGLPFLPLTVVQYYYNYLLIIYVIKVMKLSKRSGGKKGG